MSQIHFRRFVIFLSFVTVVDIVGSLGLIALNLSSDKDSRHPSYTIYISVIMSLICLLWVATGLLYWLQKRKQEWLAKRRAHRRRKTTKEDVERSGGVVVELEDL